MTETPQTIGPLERALWVRGMEPFGGLRARPLAALAHLMGEDFVAAGAPIRAPGGRTRGVRLLVDGRVRAHGDAGAEVIVEAPQAIGLVELLAGRELRAGLTAETDATILTLESAALFDLLEEEFAFVVQLRQALGRSLAAWHQTRGDWAPDPAPPVLAAPPLELDRFVDRMLILHRAPLLRAFGVAVLATLLRDDAARHLAAGEALFAAGDAAERILVIGDGVVVGTTPDGGSFRAGPGSLLGENEALIGIPHACSAACETPAAVIALDPLEIWDAAEDHFHVARALLTASARRLLRLEDRLLGSLESPPPSAQPVLEVSC